MRFQLCRWKAGSVFHIIALDRKVPGERLPFDLVRERIAVWLEAAAWSKAVAQYITILAGAAQIEGYQPADRATGPLVAVKRKEPMGQATGNQGHDHRSAGYGAAGRAAPVTA